MSVGSFSASLAGLNANQQKLSVIGNNLANINTIGFKASNVQFADLVSQSIGGPSADPMQVGLGVTVGAVTPSFTQGGIESTGVATNVAIQGQGFFVIGDSGNRTYTRAGNFGFDPNGRLVTPDGRPVQGYTAVDPVTGLISTTGQPADVIVPPGVMRPPTASTTFGTLSNLDSSAPVGATFAASVQIYDSLGEAHVVSLTYTKTAVNSWGYTVSVPGADVTGGTPGTPSVLATGSLAFDPLGVLTSVNGGAVAAQVITAPAWSNGAAPINFSWDLLDANGVAALTGYASASATASVSQNGSAAGAISGIIVVDNAGRLQASFGAGRTVTIGQLALSSFNNPQGLVKLGTNQFAESESSGGPSIGVAGSGGRGMLIGGALEQSNVDIAQEFTQMILAQRGYQANSKSITVADELLLETLNLKR